VRAVERVVAHLALGRLVAEGRLRNILAGAREDRHPAGRLSTGHRLLLLDEHLTTALGRGLRELDVLLFFLLQEVEDATSGDRLFQASAELLRGFRRPRLVSSVSLVGPGYLRQLRVFRQQGLGASAL